MKSSFGHQSCHLLQINSRSVTAVETTDTSFPDPWGQFLHKTPDNMVCALSVECLKDFLCV
ncbi:hypothetical protein DPMN_174353 [Dreissena polymorpha]|uniref:Uncharacterized protein n=1 Tax=Dreissena polymorpha TaxID=45954 RepID=A0A9D4E5V0_DREPO|nr:hypothetical protein DPMN_174353 [Dreissena polymorpha]